MSTAPLGQPPVELDQRVNGPSGLDRRRFIKACGGLAAGTLVGNQLASSANAAPAGAKGRSDLVRFGPTDLYVTRYCQGTAFRQVQRSDNPAARRILHKCLDVGINFFDSAEAYGWDGSEIVLGKAIAGRRDQVVICTKAAPSLKPQRDPDTNQFKLGGKCTLTREMVIRKAEGSLKRLDTDYIDLFMYHSPDDVTPVEELAASMDALVKAGKIRYWGASNFPAQQIDQFCDVGRANHQQAPIAGTEDYFHIAVGERYDPNLFKVIRENGLGMLAFSPQNEGQLSPGRDSKLGKAKTQVVRALDKVTHDVGATRPQVCIAWVLSHPEVTSVLGGAESPAHVEENFGGTRLKLPPEALATLNAASEKYLQHRMRRLKEEKAKGA